MTQPNNGYPPAELIQKWRTEAPNCRDGGIARENFLVRKAADWQLDRCCEEMKSIPSSFGIPFGEIASNALRATCRTKPPSLKQQALEALGPEPLPVPTQNGNAMLNAGEVERYQTIRRALELLQDDRKNSSIYRKADPL